jgi:type IV secretion system protein VirB2
MTNSFTRTHLVILLGITLLALMPEIALAAPWDTAASRVLGIFTGGLARTLAIISVIACGEPVTKFV